MHDDLINQCAIRPPKIALIFQYAILSAGDAIYVTYISIAGSCVQWYRVSGVKSILFWCRSRFIARDNNMIYVPLHTTYSNVMICQQTRIFGHQKLINLIVNLLSVTMENVYMKRLCSCWYGIVFNILNLILNWMTVSRWRRMIVGATICRKKLAIM